MNGSAEVEKLHVSDLIFDEENARKHNELDITKGAKVLQEVGFARSIVIDENNIILAGNGVTEAAQIVGLENVKVVEADGNTIIAVRRRGLTDEQKKRLALWDNRLAELSEWDMEYLLKLQEEQPDLLNGLMLEDDLAEYQNLLNALEDKEEAEALEDDTDSDDLVEKYGVGMGQTWQCGVYQIIGSGPLEKNFQQRLFLEAFAEALGSWEKNTGKRPVLVQMGEPDTIPMLVEAEKPKAKKAKKQKPDEPSWPDLFNQDIEF